MVKVVENIHKNFRHEFAFHVSDIAHVLLSGGKTKYTVVDKDLVHRIIRVVKVSVGQTFTLFDKKQHVLCTLISCSKSNFTMQANDIKRNNVLQKDIRYLLPLLKKEALESSVYSLAELGVTSIQLVITEKSRKKLASEKELLRLEKIVISAAEQSKYFAYPAIHKPKMLSSCLDHLSSEKQGIVFDPKGNSFFDIHKQTTSTDICLAVGPEGGFVQEELDLFKSYKFSFCRLTPTILRALQAVAVSAAMFRL